MREVKKNWLEPADGLKKKKKNLRQAEMHSTKHHVWTNPTFTKTLLVNKKVLQTKVKNKPEAEETLNVNGKNPRTWVTEGETERERAVLFSVFCVWVSRAGHCNTIRGRSHIASFARSSSLFQM